MKEKIYIETLEQATKLIDVLTDNGYACSVERAGCDGYEIDVVYAEEGIVFKTENELEEDYYKLSNEIHEEYEETIKEELKAEFRECKVKEVASTLTDYELLEIIAKKHNMMHEFLGMVKMVRDEETDELKVVLALPNDVIEMKNNTLVLE